MQKATGILVTLITAAGLGGFGAIAQAQDMSAQATYADIEKTLGTVPGFFKMFPEAGVVGAWAEFKSVQLNPKTKLDGGRKDQVSVFQPSCPHHEGGMSALNQQLYAIFRDEVRARRGS